MFVTEERKEEAEELFDAVAEAKETYGARLAQQAADAKENLTDEAAKFITQVT